MPTSVMATNFPYYVYRYGASGIVASTEVNYQIG